MSRAMINMLRRKCINPFFWEDFLLIRNEAIWNLIRQIKWVNKLDFSDCLRSNQLRSARTLWGWWSLRALCAAAGRLTDSFKRLQEFTFSSSSPTEVWHRRRERYHAFTQRGREREAQLLLYARLQRSLDRTSASTDDSQSCDRLCQSGNRVTWWNTWIINHKFYDFKMVIYSKYHDCISNSLLITLNEKNTKFDIYIV